MVAAAVRLIGLDVLLIAAYFTSGSDAKASSDNEHKWALVKDLLGQSNSPAILLAGGSRPLGWSPGRESWRRRMGRHDTSSKV